MNEPRVTHEGIRDPTQSALFGSRWPGGDYYCRLRTSEFCRKTPSVNLRILIDSIENGAVFPMCGDLPTEICR